MNTQHGALFKNINDCIKDSTDQRFMSDVIEASRSVIVLVDFHAPWCTPCRHMTPLLEKHVRLAQGAIHLVKIDIDRNPAVVTQLRISSIPAVYVFYQGKLADYVMGALSERQIKDFIARILSFVKKTPSDNHLVSLLKSAQNALDENHFSKAADLFHKVLHMDSAHADAYIGLIRCYMATHAIKKLRKMLDNLPTALKDNQEILAIGKTFQTFIKITEEAQNVASFSVLQQRVKENPLDHQTQYDLSLAYFIQGNREQAVESLLVLIQAAPEWHEQKARKLLLKLFDIFGIQHPLTVTTRRRLSKILFS